jgi:hypothetical protein
LGDAVVNLLHVFLGQALALALQGLEPNLGQGLTRFSLAFKRSPFRLNS